MRHARYGARGHTPGAGRRRLKTWHRVVLVILLSLVSPLCGVIALGEMINSASAHTQLNYSTTGCAYFDRCDVDVSRVDIRP